MIPTLSGACYAVKSIVRDSDINTLKSIYFHSVTKYEIILSHISSNGGNIFASQNITVRIISNEQHKVYFNNWR